MIKGDSSSPAACTVVDFSGFWPPLIIFLFGLGELNQKRTSLTPTRGKRSRSQYATHPPLPHLNEALASYTEHIAIEDPTLGGLGNLDPIPLSLNLTRFHTRMSEVVLPLSDNVHNVLATTPE